MLSIKIPIRTTFYRNRFTYALAVFLLLTAGCVANYGRLEPSLETGNLFESYQVLPDFNYYYTGGQNNPRVIIGIHKEYTLKTSSWTPMVQLTSDTLKKRVAGMTHQIGRAPINYGWVILNPAGEKVGVWYSKLSQTSVKFGENNEISVSQPRDVKGDERRGRFNEI